MVLVLCLIITYLLWFALFFWVEKLLFNEKPVLEEKELEEVPWTLQQTIIGTVATLLPWVLFTIGSSLMQDHATRTAALPPGEDLLNAIIVLIFSALVEAAFLIAPFYYALQPYRTYPLRQRLQLALRSLGFHSFSWRSATSLIMGCLVAIFVINIVYAQLIAQFHLNLQTNDQFILNLSKTAPLTTYATLLVAVVVAPFCEEIFFRGFVLPGLLKALSGSLAIFWCAFLFALAHGDIGSFAVLFAIGLALSFLRWRTRSIWPSIILHMLNNGLSALLIVLVMLGVMRA